MEIKELTFEVDPRDFDGMLKIMDKYGDSNTLYTGMNGNLENVQISVFHDRLSIATFQSNGWERKNVYWRDGTREERFVGKWNK